MRFAASSSTATERMMRSTEMIMRQPVADLWMMPVRPDMGPGGYSHTFAGREIRMRLNFASAEHGVPQHLDILFGDFGWRLRRAHIVDNTGHLQRAMPALPGCLNKHISWEKGQRYVRRPAVPVMDGRIQRQEVRNSPVFKVTGDDFFMASPGIDRIPTKRLRIVFIPERAFYSRFEFAGHLWLQDKASLSSTAEVFFQIN